MNGRLLPIPGCNEPKTVKHSIGSIWGHLADARPDVTQRGADQGEARALTLAKCDLVRYRQSLGLRDHAPIFVARRRSFSWRLSELHTPACARNMTSRQVLSNGRAMTTTPLRPRAP